LTPFRKILSPELFQSILPCNWRSSTVLIPEVVFWLMATVATGDGAMAGAAASFWATLRVTMPWLPSEPVTEEAFCIARKSLPVRFLRRLFQLVLLRFAHEMANRYRWKGFRLLGIDGMDFQLPHSDLLTGMYPAVSNQYGPRVHPQARLLGLVGLWDGLCHDFRLVPIKYSEQRCARIVIKALKAGDLLLADRNFPDYHTMAAVISQGAEFLFHLPSNRFHKLSRQSTPSGRSDEWNVVLQLPKKLRQKCPHLQATIKARILKYQLPGFRTSWLITSLEDTEKYPYKDVVALYHERWRQETAHREWKYTLGMDNLRSKTPQGILKEVLVQMTLNNVIRWIMAEAAGIERRPVDLQFLASKRLILAAVPAMTAAQPATLPCIYRELLASIAQLLILVRPGRKYPRPFDDLPRNKGHGKFVIPAKLPSTKEANHVFI
jgi:hypothetical protein